MTLLNLWVIIKTIKLPLLLKSNGSFIVTTMGFEPTRPCEHQPLKLASLPFLHVAYKQKKPNIAVRLCDPTGARTQDPIIKSDVLYQLSYRVFAFKIIINMVI